MNELGGGTDRYVPLFGRRAEQGHYGLGHARRDVWVRRQHRILVVVRAVRRVAQRQARGMDSRPVALGERDGDAFAVLQAPGRGR